MTTMRRYGTLVLAAVGVVAVLTSGGWRWAAFVVFAVLLGAILAVRFADG